MVSGALGKQIVFCIIAIGLAVVLSLFFFIRHNSTANTKNLVYSATNDALDLAVLDGIVAADRNFSQPGGDAIRAVVVPHHLVASKSIALGIKALASSTPRIIIVISPDHYDRCPKMLCTTNGSYKSFFGNTSISEKDVAQLEKSSDLVADSELFTEEHGIYTIVPFIKHYIPDAQIIPIVISQKSRGSEQDRAEVIKILKPFLSQKDVSLVISSDFSHYLPLAESNQMDEKTQNSFCSGNSGEILDLKNPSQSDCPLCLWVLEQEARELGFWNPILITHTNSANLMNDITAKETTSHFTFILSAISSPGSCPLNTNNNAQDSPDPKILIVGDMMFDRYIRKVSDKRGTDFLFSCIDPLLKNADFAVGNLEGPITTNASVSEGTIMDSPENYNFTFPISTAAMLFQHNIRVVSIGNNHISNYGLIGIDSTHKYLSEAGISYFGGLAGDAPVYRTEDKGVELSFVNYNEFGGDSADKIAETIAAEHILGRVVIVYAHWGQEYSDDIKQIRSVAELFSKNGADLIIGSHPHIILPREYIGNTLVYYSLGNFIFDQYWDLKVTKGLAILIKISGKKITAEEYPVVLNKDGRTCPASIGKL